MLKLLRHIGLAWLALPSLVYFELLCSHKRRARRVSPASPGQSPRRPFVADGMRHSHGDYPSFGRRHCLPGHTPLSIWKLYWTDFQPILNKLDNKLAHWRVSMMPKGGRLILTMVLLGAAPIHVAGHRATEASAWGHCGIPVIFFWGGQWDSYGGNCLVAWRDVCWPVKLGRFGI